LRGTSFNVKGKLDEGRKDNVSTARKSSGRENKSGFEMVTWYLRETLLGKAEGLRRKEGHR